MPRGKSAAAESFAQQVNRQDRAELVVIPESSSPPLIVLSKAPVVSGAESLGGILRALGVARSDEVLSDSRSVELLQSLWPGGFSDLNELPAIRRGQPASFLVASPAPEGQIDLNSTALHAIWIDGVEIDTAR